MSRPKRIWNFFRGAGVGLLVSCGQKPSLQPQHVDDGGSSSSFDASSSSSPGDGSFASDATFGMNPNADGGCASNQAGCPCSTAGQTVACWTGPASERNVGACHDGTMTCGRNGEFAAWGPCMGEQRICAEDSGVLPPHDSGPPSDGETADGEGGEETDGEGGEAEAGPPPPQSCLPGSSLSALISGANVTAYVPVGSWSQLGTGVVVVPIEGTGFNGTGRPATIATPNVVNTCGGNSLTGEVVCTSNGTDVYLIKGTVITRTLTSAANVSESFSGGACQTCNVAIDPSNNRAFLSIGYGDPDASPVSGAAFQSLDLATGMLGAPIAADPSGTSEALLVDTVRGFVLSPNEQSNYQLLNTATGQVYSFKLGLDGSQSAVFDAPGEDCLTGIALAADEYTGNILLVDLTQATFSSSDAGSPDGAALQTWWAPNNLQSVPEFATFSAGTDGIAVAPRSHIGVVAGEFGGTDFGAFVLPSTSGSGTPALVDWVAATIPDTPDQTSWGMGGDPHTLTAYTSPANGKPYAIFQNGATSTLADGAPGGTFLAVVDLTALLARQRVASSSSLPHTLATPLGSSDTCIGSPGSLAPNPPGCIVRFIQF